MQNRDHSVLSNDRTACCSRLQYYDWPVSHDIVPREKSAPCDAIFHQNSFVKSLAIYYTAEDTNVTSVQSNLAKGRIAVLSPLAA